ncbi:MAG: MBL fold metallo-hydrolase, partial [Rhizobiales bacterium]|nr:MBL fold metallo-hydrolase [Hyphomicrobiales bacterium]
NNPRNRRRRCSLLIEKIGENGTTKIIVDTGPDFREQCLSAEIDWADAVFYTHPHADHTHGIDDLRAFVLNRRQKVQIYADSSTLSHLRKAFDYCFETPEGSSYPPILIANEIVHGQAITIDGAGGNIEITPFNQQHGSILSLGFRVGDVAYSSDISALPAESEQHLEGLSVWIVDALRTKPHPSHYSVNEALEIITVVAPKRAVLTHMHNDLDYDILRMSLPKNIEPAFDGWSAEFSS